MSPKMITLESAPRPSAANWVLAQAAANSARLLIRLNPFRLRTVLEFLRRGAHPASQAEAARARSEVVGSSQRCTGPRCLERSVATALLCRLRGAWPDWCTGVSLEPFSAHAWVEAEGEPVGEEPSEIRLLRVVMRVPADATT